MPRGPYSRAREVHKKVLTDPVFHSKIVADFTSRIMRHGKKSLATRIVNGALAMVRAHFIDTNKTSEEFFQKLIEKNRDVLGLHENDKLPDAKIGLVALHGAMENTRPLVKMTSVRMGGDTRQAPKHLEADDGERFAQKFIKNAALARRRTTKFVPGDKGMIKLLGLEIIDAYDGRGEAVKKREETHRMAKANQAFLYKRPSDTTEISSL